MLRAFPKASPGPIWPELSPHAEQRAGHQNGAIVGPMTTGAIARRNAGAFPPLLEKLEESNVSKQTDQTYCQPQFPPHPIDHSDPSTGYACSMLSAEIAPWFQGGQLTSSSFFFKVVSKLS